MNSRVAGLMVQKGASHRRDFLQFAALGFVGVGAAVSLWPLIHQMNPHSGTPPPETIEVDLGPIGPGQAIIVTWRGKPISIRHRTDEEVRVARATRISDLIDPFARNEALPDRMQATDENRTKAGYDRWIVVVALCTHLNCVLKPGERIEGADDLGWFCPCHAARFDLSGRVRAGPAPRNLLVPPYAFAGPSQLRIG